MPTFNPQIASYLDKCPPTEAHSIEGEIYRGIKKIPISNVDFLSHVEHPQLKGDEKNCEHWGLSVWRTLEGVMHARELHNYMRKWYIAVGSVDSADGVFMETPSGSQPMHCTFWKADGVDLVPKFQVVMSPISEASK